MTTLSSAALNATIGSLRATPDGRLLVSRFGHGLLEEISPTSGAVSPIGSAQLADQLPTNGDFVLPSGMSMLDDGTLTMLNTLSAQVGAEVQLIMTAP